MAGLFVLSLWLLVSTFISKGVIKLIELKKAIPTSLKASIYIMMFIILPIIVAKGHDAYLSTSIYLHPDKVTIEENPKDYPSENWKYALRFSGKRITANHPALLPTPRYLVDTSETIFINQKEGLIEAKDLSLTDLIGHQVWERNSRNQFFEGFIEFKEDKLFVNLRFKEYDEISISKRYGNYDTIYGGRIISLFAPNRYQKIARLGLSKEEEIVVYNKCNTDYRLSMLEIEALPKTKIIYRGKLGEFSTGYELRKIMPNLRAHQRICASLPSHPNLRITLENNSENFRFNGLLEIN